MRYLPHHCYRHWVCGRYHWCYLEETVSSSDRGDSSLSRPKFHHFKNFTYSNHGPSHMPKSGRAKASAAFANSTPIPAKPNTSTHPFDDRTTHHPLDDRTTQCGLFTFFYLACFILLGTLMLPSLMFRHFTDYQNLDWKSKDKKSPHGLGSHSDKARGRL